MVRPPGPRRPMTSTPVGSSPGAPAAVAHWSPEPVDRGRPRRSPQRVRGDQAAPGAPVRGVGREHGRRPWSRCATTTCTGPGCPGTRRTRAWRRIFRSALLSRGRRRGLRRRWRRPATSCTSATSPRRTFGQSTPAQPVCSTSRPANHALFSSWLSTSPHPSTPTCVPRFRAGGGKAMFATSSPRREQPRRVSALSPACPSPTAWRVSPRVRARQGRQRPPPDGTVARGSWRTPWRQRGVYGGQVFRGLRWLVLVAVAWIVIDSIPDIARYFRIRAM